MPLHFGKHNDEVQLYAFDILALDGDDLRGLPLSMRKTNLAQLLARRPDGIFVAPFEQGEIGPDLFRAACGMGLEGLVSKRRDLPTPTARWVAFPFRVLAVRRNETIALRIWSHRDRVEVGHWNPEFRYAAQPHLYRQRGQSGNPSGNWRTIALGIGNRA